MPLLLNIDTATEHASICLSKGDTILGLIESTEQKNHASFVQPAIQQLMTESGYTLSQVDAIAVTSGPGSYTGLRVGLASAKGICYVLQKPLILVNTLEVMAQAILSHYQSNDQHIDPSTLLCSLIDARRMEVFTALYDPSLKEIEPPHALVIDEKAFSAQLSAHPMIFSGSGHHKLKDSLLHPAATFLNIQHNASQLAIRAVNAYQSNHFADLAYSEPLYVKEFFDTRKKG
ncbi:MAG: tRNA (adenosine(37)-N6)-threonylcarbamoyltransferase complex dimerization subunit type 1 TsaB [Bacteroidota bacterium]